MTVSIQTTPLMDQTMSILAMITLSQGTIRGPQQWLRPIYPLSRRVASQARCLAIHRVATQARRLAIRRVARRAACRVACRVAHRAAHRAHHLVSHPLQYPVTFQARRQVIRQARRQVIRQACQGRQLRLSRRVPLRHQL